MSLRSLYVFFLIALFSLSAAPSDVQARVKNLEYWAGKSRLEKKMQTLPHLTRNEVRKLKSSIGKPKRVGLVSVYIFDTGSYKYSAMAHTYGGTYAQMSGLSFSGANHFATRLAEESVPGLKKAFADHGMELLTPTEFVKTEEQFNALNDFKLKQGRMAKVTKRLVSFFEKNPKMSAAANGFPYIPANVFVDAQSKGSLEELRKALGLDAIAVLSHNTVSSKKNIGHIKIELNLFGPNPNPMPKNKLARIAYSEGAVYAMGFFGRGYKGSLIAVMRKGEIKSEDYKGLTRIVEVLGDETLKSFEKEYEKGK